MRRKEKGITLIALVITVILLLILAGVTIRWVTTGDSIFKYADIAKKETKRGEIKEYLDVSLVDERTAGYKETVETIIKNTQKRVKENGKSDLSAIAKEVETKEVETKKYNEKDAEYYFYVVVDEEVYKVGANGAEYIGRKSSEEIEIQEGEIKFEYSKSELTNENVKVTIINKTNIEGATLLYKTTGEKDGSEGWKEYNGEIEIEKNCSIFAKVSGITGEIKTATGKVENIDKLEPNTFTPNGSATTNTITVTANAEDHEKTEEYATSGIAGYSFSIDGENWSDYKEEGIYTFDKLTQSKPYTIKVKAKDKVGNEMSTPVETTVSTKAMVEATTGTGGNITFSGLSSKWTNKDVTVTASTTSEYAKLGYKVQTSTDTKKWDDKAEQTLSANGKVYARLLDSTGQYAEGDSWATANVTNIDKEAPTVNFQGTANGATDVSLSISVSEKQSKIYYAWTNSDSLPKNWTEGTNGNYSENKSITTAGKYYFWAKDEANNVVKSTADVTKSHTHSTSCYTQKAGYYQWYKTEPNGLEGKYTAYYYQCTACGAVVCKSNTSPSGQYHCTQNILTCGLDENFGVNTKTEKVNQ